MIDPLVLKVVQGLIVQEVKAAKEGVQYGAAFAQDGERSWSVTLMGADAPSPDFAVPSWMAMAAGDRLRVRIVGRDRYVEENLTRNPAGSSLANPMTTLGSLIVGGVGGTPTALAPGTDGQVLTVQPDLTLAWEAGGGGGAHPDLATHDALGLATDADVSSAVATHAATPHGGAITDHTHAATGSGANGGGATLAPTGLTIPGSSFGSPVATGTANADGAATTAARANHVHKHAWVGGSIHAYDAAVTSSGALATIKAYGLLGSAVTNWHPPRSGTLVGLTVRLSAARTGGAIKFNVRSFTASANLALTVTIDGTNTQMHQVSAAPGSVGNTFVAGETLQIRSEVTAATFAPITASVTVWALFAFDL